MTPPGPRNAVTGQAVIDASVALKLFVPEELSAQAEALFEQLGRPEPVNLYVPGFFFIECANVFRKWVRQFGYPEKDAGRNLNDLMSLGLGVIPTQVLAPEALKLALHFRITAYDASCAAAASLAGAPFITADKRLANSINSSKLPKGTKSAIEVIWLGEMEA